MPKIKGSVVFIQSSNYMSDSIFFKLLLTFGTDKKVTGLFQAFHSHHHVFIKVNTDFSLISNAAFPICFPACYIRTRALEPIPVCVNRRWGKSWTVSKTATGIIRWSIILIFTLTPQG